MINKTKLVSIMIFESTYRVSHMYLNDFRMPLGDSGVMVLQFWKQIVKNIYFEHSFCYNEISVTQTQPPGKGSLS